MELKKAGITGEKIAGYHEEFHRHLDIGLEVLAGRADSGPCIMSVAMLLDLDYIPLRKERYDLLITRERFFDEGTYEFPFVGNAIAKQPNQTMYLIFDEHSKKYMKEVGIDFGAGIYVPVATKLDNVDDELQRGIDKGEVFVAEKIEKLADMINIDTDKLSVTIERYNEFCHKGHDEQFAKNPKFLHPVKTPKFYAIRACPTLVGTVGGIKINSNTEVLSKNDEVIPGLYAAGNCAGGMYGDTYDAVTSGLTISFAVSSGRIAAEHALRYMGKESFAPSSKRSRECEVST
jgi:fumarate reductase flavoprotein subunit